MTMFMMKKRGQKKRYIILDKPFFLYNDNIWMRDDI